MKKTLFEKLGKATINPKIIEINAAIRDNNIVAPNPPTRNLILARPDFVVGSITYQPQFPEFPEQPTKEIDRNIDNIKKYIHFFKTYKFLKKNAYGCG